MSLTPDFKTQKNILNMTLLACQKNNCWIDFFEKISIFLDGNNLPTGYIQRIEMQCQLLDYLKTTLVEKGADVNININNQQFIFNNLINQLELMKGNYEKCKSEIDSICNKISGCNEIINKINSILKFMNVLITSDLPKDALEKGDFILNGGDPYKAKYLKYKAKYLAFKQKLNM